MYPNPKFDIDFDELVHFEYTQIVELVKGSNVSEVTMEELKKQLMQSTKGRRQIFMA